MMKYLFRAILPLLLAMFFSLSALGQPPPPEPGEDGDQQPAPIGGGMVILLVMGAAYGARKVYKGRKIELRE